jgi:hypothetical protein
MTRFTKNIAYTTDGTRCISMTKNKTWSYYSCLYVEVGGRRYVSNRQWDMQGNSLDGRSNLDLATVQSGVYTI